MLRGVPGDLSVSQKTKPKYYIWVKPDGRDFFQRFISGKFFPEVGTVRVKDGIGSGTSPVGFSTHREGLSSEPKLIMFDYSRVIIANR